MTHLTRFVACVCTSLRHGLLASAMSAVVAQAATPVMPNGTQVRFMEAALGPGWQHGRVGMADNGCTMVVLDRKSPGGHTSMSFAAIRSLQAKTGGTWGEVPVRELNTRQPSHCRDGGDND